MKKVWICVLAIFMLVSASSFAGAAVDNLGFKDQILKDSIEIPLSTPVTITSGNDVKLAFEVSNIKAYDLRQVSFNMKVVDENGNDVTANISSFQAIVTETNVATSSVTVSNYPVTSGQVIALPNGFSSSINMSAAIKPSSYVPAATFKVEFNGTAAEDMAFNNAKVIFTINSADTIREDVHVAVSGNLVESGFKLIKEVIVDPEVPATPTKDLDGNTSITPEPYTVSDLSGGGKNTKIQIKKSADPISYVITYKGIVDISSPTISGPVDNVVTVIYPTIRDGEVFIHLNFTTNDIPNDINPVKMHVEPDVADQIAISPIAVARSPDTIAMISTSAPTGMTLSNVGLTFTIPKNKFTLTEDTVAVYHVGDDGVTEITDFSFDDSDINTYAISFTSTKGFSSYAVAKVDAAPGPGPVDPVPTSGGGSSGSSTWATTTPTPTATPTPTTTPTGTPTEGAPTDVPTSGQPTKPAGTPAPILGILAGLAIAGIVLRRK